MTDHEDLYYRLKKVEEREERITELLSQLENAVARLTFHIEQVKDQKLIERLRNLEIEMVNQKLISKAVQWLAITVGGSAIVITMTYVFTK